MTSNTDPTDEEYNKGLDILSSLISGRVRSDGKNWSHAFDMMQVYLERLGLEKELSKLSVIHVAGTKGKGSTCAMIESILRKAGYKTGLYTSPHLIDVRERIRINGVPIDKSTFLRHLWSCYQTLEDKATDDAGKPAYFRFLTLLSFKIFLEQDVDVAILEVGLGGRLDATNCVREPVVCGVTPLGFDHMALLGHTLPEIAKEKAGIFKKGRPAFTVAQREDAQAKLEEVAKNVGCPLQTVQSIDDYNIKIVDADNSNNSNNTTNTNSTTNSNTIISAKDGLHIGLAGQHQRQNASLAVVLAAQWEALSPKATAKTGHLAKQRAHSILNDNVLPREYIDGLEVATWPGRGHIVYDTVVEGMPSSQLTFYLDGAHTAESMKTCADWFLHEVISNSGNSSSSNDHSATINTFHTNNNSNNNNTQLQSQSSSIKTSSPLIVDQFSSTHRILLFNCMEERHPEDLLTPLVSTLMQHENDAMPHHAFFLPPESSYMKVGTTTTDSNNTDTSNTTSDNNNNSSSMVDITWQMHVRDIWESLLQKHRQTQGTHLHPPTTTTTITSSSSSLIYNVPNIPIVPGITATQDATKGAVLPSLRVALDWLRKCARERPTVKMQVLVTGSLYLVGDLLRILHQNK